jgi:hypothetical protein
VRGEGGAGVRGRLGGGVALTGARPGVCAMRRVWGCRAGSLVTAGPRALARRLRPPQTPALPPSSPKRLPTSRTP